MDLLCVLRPSILHYAQTPEAALAATWSLVEGPRQIWHYSDLVLRGTSANDYRPIVGPLNPIRLKEQPMDHQSWGGIR